MNKFFVVLGVIAELLLAVVSVGLVVGYYLFSVLIFLWLSVQAWNWLF